MAYLLKDPGARVDYMVDWAADYLNQESLATSDWTIDPVELGGVTLFSSRIDGGQAIAVVEGGLDGHVYRLTNAVLTSAGRRDRRSVVLRVEKR